MTGDLKPEIRTFADGLTGAVILSDIDKGATSIKYARPGYVER